MHKITADLLAKDKERYETNTFAANHNPEIMSLAQLFQLLAFPDKAAKLMAKGEVNFFPAPVYIQQAISLIDRPALKIYIEGLMEEYARRTTKNKEKE